ncbi:capsular polysaccharide biosynthesis protein [Vreelandella hamiltonii]|uniref:Capsule polysaccharide modification protein LipA n=1 Tax=Vreelandella hamiltonii TaxID=502829 RepID=A0A8H9I7M5_9GAMM|nr:capsular polysaccharide biosynthesis protein [Halomonas hamiltonii]GGW38231.1 capsule polysaccharide modification protein LipA [Halomonas hamiltonii]
MAKRTAGYTSSGIGKIATLSVLLSEFDDVIPIRPFCSPPSTVIGWGLKPTTRQSKRYAERKNLPHIALEDGFLRSLGLGVEGYQPHSMVVDVTGIYYDASRPSDLETSLNEATFSSEELARAERCMALLRHHRLSKYNHAPDTPLNHSNATVLVVDQTAGDASITYGGASSESFQHMLQEALANHPDEEILVKIHPDVIAGKKQGHLTQALDHPRCRIISEDINPWALFDQVSSVYVVTSQLGFEALMAGKQVHCFGLPFYAGWGLTQDKLACPRRTRTRSLPEVFAAAYLRYARYANPYTCQPATLEETITLLADQRRQQERLRGPWVACGFSAWKRGFIGCFLGPCANIHYQETLPSTIEGTPSAPRILAWSSALTPEFKARNAHALHKVWRIEDGFIRSVGLGADLTTPLSLAIDHQGIYYDPTQPSELETLLETHAFDAPLLERAAALRERLVALKLSKYNVYGQAKIDLPSGKHIILVPGQVESDASIATGSPQVSTNSALLRAVRQGHPDAFIIYKAHPDVTSGARVGKLDSDAKQLYDLDGSHMEITALLERVDAVHTMSSLTGFEALLRHRQVHTYGLPFYAGWGLTRDAMHCPRRTRKLTLDELVAGTLLVYPGYVDPNTGQLCNAETVVALLEQTKTRQHHSQKHLLTWKQRLYRSYRNVFIGRH